MAFYPTPRSNLHDLHRYRTREYRILVQELKEARARLACGPEVLDLISEIAAVAEALLDYRDETGLGGRSCCPAGDAFLAALTEAAEEVRRSGGEIDRDFLDLLDNLPVLQKRAAA